MSGVGEQRYRIPENAINGLGDDETGVQDNTDQKSAAEVLWRVPMLPFMVVLVMVMPITRVARILCNWFIVVVGHLRVRI